MASNFELIKEIYLENIDSTGFLYKHKSGAQLIFIKNQDQNKVFSVSFKTLPDNNKGTAHVLEHCTLCGSEKFPFKDTFNELSGTRLYSYLNAMTFKDKTIYPVASMYENELIYLVKVYLDCVYNPLLRLETFLHEAWHYEKQISGPDVNGVVYSEMKAAFSNPARETRSFIHKKLFPQTIYQYEAAGIPKKILELKHEEIVDFHKKYYVPQNSFLYLYGDIKDINIYFELFESYLSENKKTESNQDQSRDKDEKTNDIEKTETQEIQETQEKYEGDMKDRFVIQKQNKFVIPALGSGLYDFSGAQKNFFGAGFVIGDSSNMELILAINTLNSYLSKMVGAPLKKFLPLVKTFFESDILQPVYSILSENFNGSTDKFRDTLIQIFGQIHTKGLNKSLLETCINNLEFEIRADVHKYRPKGLTLNLLILTNWIHGFDPFAKIDRIKILNSLKYKVHENYFDDIVKNYILFNKHSAFVSLMPDTKSSFDFTVSQDDIENADKMREFIKSEEEDKIKLADLNNTKPNKFDEIIEHNDDTDMIIHTKIDTDEIIHIDFVFYAACVPESLLPYVGILSEILVFVSLQVSSTENMETVMNNISRIKVITDTYSNNNEYYTPVLILKIKMLLPDTENIIDMLSIIFKSDNFDSKNLIKKILMQKFATMHNAFLTSPAEALVRKIISYNSNEYKYKDITSGIEHYIFIKKLLQEFDNKYDDLIKNLSETFKFVFTQNNVAVHVACDQKNFDVIYPKIKDVTQKLPDIEHDEIEYSFVNYKTDEAYFTTASVNSNALIVPIEDLELNGFIYVFEAFMNKYYLMQEVRVKGGAYDCRCKFKNNAIYFYSYADPNIYETFIKFLDAANFLLEYNFSDYDLKKCIVNAINNFDKQHNTDERCDLSAERYFCAFKQEHFGILRSQILDCSVDDIKEISARLKNNLDRAMICTIGSRKKVTENENSFREIIKL